MSSGVIWHYWQKQLQLQGSDIGGRTDKRILTIIHWSYGYDTSDQEIRKLLDKNFWKLEFTEWLRRQRIGLLKKLRLNNQIMQINVKLGNGWKNVLYGSQKGSLTSHFTQIVKRLFQSWFSGECQFFISKDSIKIHQVDGTAKIQCHISKIK